ncbi:TolC family protein [Nitrospina watsonii]|uniref:Heavy metal RND efflux outer membrane protein, CzcC family n=1 Tax=Nitrospina watsonii TaxID=1323948 RepID=A0ABN8W0E9_9BACT|nr:TolC family protein [Nitrospina watsonii]CAI2718284.1 Heavy metal RND efflux outer membrane protein, CzcC family [Nitrospina watsonii]
MCRIWFALFLLYWFPTPALAEAENEHHRIFKATLNSFIQEAVQNNPELAEARQKINVLKEIPPQRESLDDPMLELGLWNLPVDTFSFRQEAMTQKQIEVSQAFPFPGKLGLRSQDALHDVRIAEQTLRDLELEVVKKVKTSFYELCFIRASLDTTHQNKILLEQFVTIAETKYAVGKGIQQDVLQAQLELSKILDRIIELQQLKEQETARLNTLMDRLPQAPLNIPHGLPQTPFSFKTDELQTIAEQNRPALKAVQEAIEKMKIRKQLAEKEYYPDFKVGFRYGQRQDSAFQDHPDFVSGFVGVNIPIWQETKQDRKVAEENYRISVFKETYRKIRSQIFMEIKILLDKEKKNRELIQLVKTGIIPQAKQSLESALSAYSVDKIDFLTLIDNQVTLLNWEIKYHRELTHYEQNLAALESMVGKSLFDPENPLR